MVGISDFAGVNILGSLGQGLQLAQGIQAGRQQAGLQQQQALRQQQESALRQQRLQQQIQQGGLELAALPEQQAFQQQERGLQIQQLQQKAEIQRRTLQDAAPFARQLKAVTDENKLAALQGERDRRLGANPNADVSIFDQGIELAAQGDFDTLNQSLDQVISAARPVVQPKVGRFKTLPTAEGIQIIDTATGQTQRTVKDPIKAELAKTKLEAQKVKVEGTAREKVAARDAALAEVDLGISSAQNLLVHPGLESATGFGANFPTSAGSPAADFETALESFESQVFLNQVEKMKGLGALSEAEGKKIGAAIASLSLKQSDKAMKKSLQTIIDTFNKGKDFLKTKFGVTPSGAGATPGILTSPGGVSFTVK